MNTFPERLDWLLRDLAKNGTNASDFAKRIGVTKSAISRARNGYSHSFKPENLLTIEDTFGISARWLERGEGPIYLAEGGMTQQQMTELVRKHEAGMLLDLSGLSDTDRNTLRALYDSLRKPDALDLTALAPADRTALLSLYQSLCRRSAGK